MLIGGFMRKIVVLSLLFFTTAYAHHSLHEIITLSAILEVQKCSLGDALPLCDDEGLTATNLSIELTSCEHQGDYEICSGYYDLNRERDGFPFNAIIDVKKVTLGQWAPQYEITGTVWATISSRMGNSVTIIPSSGSQLTDISRVRGEWLWTSDYVEYYQPTLHLGPALPELDPTLPK